MQSFLNKRLLPTQSVRQKPLIQAGLTLIELICIIAIIAIIATLAAPNFTHFINKRRADTTINNIFRNIELARTTAVNRGTTVTLCASKNNRTCDANGGNFFISFLDPDQDAVIDTKQAINTQIIRSTKTTKKTAKLKINNFSGIHGTIQFQADGMTVGSIQTGSISYCPQDKPKVFGRMLAISRTGRARIRAQEEFDGKTNSGKTTDNEPNISIICS